jgi:hypothetical protein
MATRSKYGNQKVEYDGETFDSQAEFYRYLQLLALLQEGEIAELQVHPSYVVIDAFTNAAGHRHSKNTYAPDFVYIDTATDQPVYEDVKGVETAEFKLKRKLFEQRYGVALTIIPAKNYS